MTSGSTASQRPTESTPLELHEQQQQPSPGQTPRVVIIEVRRSQMQESWQTYSNTAY